MIDSNVKLCELFQSGWELILMGSPSPMGPKRWALRQIINFCGPIPDKLLEKAKNLEELRDPERNGMSFYQSRLT
jgi:hypothetical protein